MTVTATWTSPSTLDKAVGAPLPAADWNLVLSNLLYLAGTAGQIVPQSNDPPIANQLTRDNFTKSWCRVAVSGGTPSVQSDYNVSGITDFGVGEYVVSWDRDFLSALYPVVATVIDNSAFAYVCKVHTVVDGTVRVHTYDLAGAAADVGFAVTAHGTQ